MTVDRDVDEPVRVRGRDLQRRLESDGFIRVPFLDGGAVARLRELWARVAPSEVKGIYSNVHSLDVDTNRRIDQVITEVFRGPFDRLFVGARLGGASFLVKGTGPDSASTPHQDWSTVEEDRTRSLSVWVPLVDVDESNGALQVIPGSHRLRMSIRSLDSPSLYMDFDEDLDPFLEAVPARAGDAVVYAHDLFHGSRPNASARVRVCAVSGIVTDGARLVHHRRVDSSDPDTFDVFEVDRDFYFSGIPAMAAGSVPDTARWVRRTTVPDHRLTAAEVLQFASQRRGRTGGWERPDPRGPE